MGSVDPGTIQIAQEIGLKKIREKCLHFSEWISKLEKLGADHRK